MYTIWISFTLFFITVAGNNIEKATYCYGDNSHGSNIVSVSCSSGAVYINDVIAATKPTSLDCAAEDHIADPVNREICCTYNETDCMKSWSGTWDAYRNCIGQTTCYGVPVIRDEPVCSDGDFPRFSNYMILEYYCMPAGYIFGPCSSTADCNDPSAMCNKTYCACQTGYTTFYAFDDCWKDGALNGSCTGAVGCQDSNTYCNYTSGRCQCDVGYIAYNGSCEQGGHNFGLCVDTADCTDPQALCDKSVCVCKAGYTAFAEFDDCWKDGGLNGSCTGSVGCHDNNTTCNTTSNRCACVSGYSAYNGLCYKDGDLHGSCNIDADCVDDNVHCTGQRCECIDGYSDIGGICREDGRLNGYCEVASVECIDDNTTCQTDSGICECVDGFTEINEECKEDGVLGGACVVDNDCVDGHAECVSQPSNPDVSLCQCKNGYTDINGQCVKDGTLNGLCNGSVLCTDNNTQCNTTNSRCECTSGHVPYSGICYGDGDLHGFCNIDSDCVDDNVQCVNERCECVDDYRDIDGQCREDWHLNGFCEVTIDCVDDNTECLEGVCECVDGYTEIDGDCMKDGDIGGLCAVRNDCKDINAECVTLSSNTALSTCECKTNYTNIEGECKQDRRLGGRCTNLESCLDASTSCSTEGICVCIVTYSEVNNICKEDEKEGGVCGQSGGNSGQCSEEHTVCEADTQLQCGGSNCIPGICQCEQGYSIGYDSSCTKDGDIGGVCNMDSDCMDANAKCIGVPLFCTCSTGYRNVDSACVKDGDPGGHCMSGNTCTDSHSICVNGTCICNDVRNYVIKEGICQRDDGFINGDCEDNICSDPNALCSNNRCICLAEYSQLNGVCTQGTISSVTSCNGSSPYNKLAPDCDKDSVPVIIEEYQRVKPASDNCPGEMNVYSNAVFAQCCSYEHGDCRLEGSGDDVCGPSDLSGAYTTYNVIDYICAHGGSVIDAATNDEVTNNQVYVTISTENVGNIGKRTCSVTASCQTDISVYLVFLNFEEVNNQCSQTLTITDSTSSTTFDCDYTVENTTMAVFTTSAGFFTFRVTNPEQGGRFVLNIEAETTTADVVVACGSEAVSDGPSSFRTCGPAAGHLGGECSQEMICVDPHTVCQNEVCRCQNGYRESNMECLKIVTKEDKTNGNALLAVIIPVVILLILATAAILFWLFKDTIRKRCFPKKEPAIPVKPVIEGPAPMNVRYTNTGVPSDVNAPKAMPLPWLNTGFNPSNERFHGNLPNDSNLRKTLPPIIHPPMAATAPMNMKHSGMLPNGTGPASITDYLYKEELEAHKNLKKKKQKKVKRNTISPTADSDVQLLANGVAGSAKSAETKPKNNKKKKKLRKTRIGIKENQAFDLPRQPGMSQEGVYRPDFNSSGGNQMNGTPFQNSIPRPFDPRASWNVAGTVASVAVQPKIRRPSVIDITPINDPSNIEHIELDNN